MPNSEQAEWGEIELHLAECNNTVMHDVAFCTDPMEFIQEAGPAI